MFCKADPGLLATLVVSFLSAVGDAQVEIGDDVCACVDPVKCVDGVVVDEAALELIRPEDVHHGEGLISERIHKCIRSLVCCSVPSGFQIPDSSSPSRDQPSRPTSSSSSSSEEDRLDDAPGLPLVHGLRGCGVKRSPGSVFKLGVDERISGVEGPENTFYGEAPWMARLVSMDKGFLCGATLINSITVLTAAHCLKRLNKGEVITVEAGEWNTESSREPVPTQIRTSFKIVSHPDFNRENLKNDVALIFLQSPFNMSETVDTICTPERLEDVESESCVAVGWGKTKMGKYLEIAATQKSVPLQPILRKVPLPLMDRNTCEDRLKASRLGPKFRLAKGFLCAGGTITGDTCEGDGGGPLYCPLKMDSHRMGIIGITAWGIECGKGNPAVFASVPEYHSWIFSTISDFLDDYEEGLLSE